MRITQFSVKNYQFTIVIFLMVLALGLTSLLNMPRGEDPPFKAPRFTIIAVYPGTSPNDMEKLVSKPIEDKLHELSDIKRIRTDINDGLSVTDLEFDYSTNADDKYNEVVRELNSIRTTLPEALLSLDVKKAESSNVNTYQLALVSQTATYKQLWDVADALKTQLEKVKELKKVEIHGYPQQQIRVSVDLEKMAQQHLSLPRIIAALQAGAQNIPGGSIDAGGKKFNIKTNGDYTSIDDIRNTVIAAAGDKMVFLRDIADVRMDDEEPSYLARFNGQRCVYITANEKDRTNILANNKAVEPLISAFKKTLPGNMTLYEGFVQAQDVQKRLSHFGRDFIIAILLVAVTLIPLGWRASSVVMISIPLSIAIGLFMLQMLGYTINQLSIVGMVVALGLLVDDSIVVIENIERYLRQGATPLRAAIDATKQISVAVVGCTAILIVSFLPILFLPEGAGDFIRSLPMAVVTTVIASLFVSLTIVPFLSRLILRPHAHPEGNIVLRKLQQLINGSYRRLLNRALAKPYWTLGFAVTLFIAACMLFKVVGFGLFPRSEKPMFLVNIETPLGTSLDKTDSVARFVEAELRRHPDVQHVFSNTGKGNPAVYYNQAQHSEASNFAQLFIRLHPLEVPEMERLVDTLRSRFDHYADAKIEVKQFEQGPLQEAPIAIRLFGDNLDTLRSLSARVEELMHRTPGTIYVNNPLQTYKTDLHLQINKDKAALLGIQTSDIDRMVRMGIAGLNVAQYKDEKGDNYFINVSLPRDQHQTLDAFNKIYIPTPAGAMVPLNQLATLEFETSVPQIKHYNKNRYALVTSFVKNGFNTAVTTQKIEAGLKEMHFPNGYGYMMAGEVESSQESFGNLGTIIVITIFAFLGILLLEFKTFKSTLIVLSVIPLGIVGTVAILLITGNTLSFISVIGIIALAGIEVKNSILLVDYTNQLRAGGMGLDEAIQEAGETRFLPIILTTLTAIGGLIPLVLERSPLYSPLAWVLVGGLISSTVLTRLVTPVMYKLLKPKVHHD